MDMCMYVCVCVCIQLSLCISIVTFHHLVQMLQIVGVSIAFSALGLITRIRMHRRHLARAAHNGAADDHATGLAPAAEATAGGAATGAIGPAKPPTTDKATADSGGADSDGADA